MTCNAFAPASGIDAELVYSKHIYRHETES